MQTCECCGGPVIATSKNNRPPKICDACTKRWIDAANNQVPKKPQPVYIYECGCENSQKRTTARWRGGVKRSWICCPKHDNSRIVKKRYECPICGKKETVTPRTNLWLRCKQCRYFVHLARRRVFDRSREKPQRRVYDKPEPTTRFPRADIGVNVDPFGGIPAFYLVQDVIFDDLINHGYEITR